MNNSSINWDDAAARAALIESVGLREYNRQMEAHRKACGHDIRIVGSRWGRLHMVGNTGRAFYTLDEARAFARGESSES